MCDKLEKSGYEKCVEPSIQYVLCSPGLSDFFDKFSTSEEMISENEADSLTTSPKLKSILKKTPHKSQKIICTPSSVAIRRTKSEICRSISARRELRFGPDTKKSPTLSRISPKKQTSPFRLRKLFRRNSVSTNRRKVDNFITSTPIYFLDGSDEHDNTTKRNWRSSIQSNLPLFFGTEKYQCAHCKRTWENNSDLLLHTSEHHKGVRHWLRPQYRCGICFTKFYSNKYLVKHCHLQHTPVTKQIIRKDFH